MKFIDLYYIFYNLICRSCYKKLLLFLVSLILTVSLTSLAYSFEFIADHNSSISDQDFDILSNGFCSDNDDSDFICNDYILSQLSIDQFEQIVHSFDQYYDQSYQGYQTIGEDYLSIVDDHNLNFSSLGVATAGLGVIGFTGSVLPVYIKAGLLVVLGALVSKSVINNLAEIFNQNPSRFYELLGASEVDPHDDVPLTKQERYQQIVKQYRQKHQKQAQDSQENNSDDQSKPSQQQSSNESS